MEIYRGVPPKTNVLTPNNNLGVVFCSSDYDTAHWFGLMGNRWKEPVVYRLQVNAHARVKYVNAHGIDAGSNPQWIEEEWLHAESNGFTVLVLRGIRESGIVQDTIVAKPESLTIVGVGVMGVDRSDESRERFISERTDRGMSRARALDEWSRECNR